MTDVNNAPDKADSLEEQLNHASEELITGDSDDPPLSEKEVVDMLRPRIAISDPSDPDAASELQGSTCIALTVCGFA